ncbi:MAG: hypothetical protein ACYCPF_10365 [Streptosporangiaceae bacterium]
MKPTAELLAALAHLSPGSVGMRLRNVEYLATGGAGGLSGVAKQTREIWALVSQHTARPEPLGAILPEDSLDLSVLTEPGLFSLYRGILRELKGRGVIRTENAPAGDYAEYLVATALGGKLAPNAEKAWDVQVGGEKLQVKARVVSDPAEPGQLQLSPFRSFDFGSAVIVLLSDTDYTVVWASKVPRDVVESAAVYRQHVNGRIVFARPDIMGHPAATDLTAALRTAQTGLGQGAPRESDGESYLWTPLRILQGVRVLHQRGYHAARILPGMSASGGYWRVSIAAAANFQTEDGHLGLRDWDSAVSYSTGGGTEFAGARVDASTTPDVVADLILSALPRLPAAGDDPVYVEWYAQLMRLVEEHHGLPIAYADYFDADRGWEIGWGSGIRYPHPPPPSA